MHYFLNNFAFFCFKVLGLDLNTGKKSKLKPHPENELNKTTTSPAQLIACFKGNTHV